MPSQVGDDEARVDGVRVYAMRRAQFVYCQREERIGRLGLAVRHPAIVLAALEVPVVEVNLRSVMPHQ
ncbi:hypothetical protein D3C79_685460 [compost metagenome]